MASSDDPVMRSRRILTQGPEGELLWVRVNDRELGMMGAAMLVADWESPPEAGSLKGMAFFGDTAEATELALRHVA